MIGILFTSTMCNGCPKKPVWNAAGWQCPVYAEPRKTISARQNKPCPFNPPAPKVTKKKFVNPLKASKRENK